MLQARWREWWLRDGQGMCRLLWHEIAAPDEATVDAALAGRDAIPGLPTSLAYVSPHPPGGLEIKLTRGTKVQLLRAPDAAALMQKLCGVLAPVANDAAPDRNSDPAGHEQRLALGNGDMRVFLRGFAAAELAIIARLLEPLASKAGPKTCPKTPAFMALAAHDSTLVVASSILGHVLERHTFSDLGNALARLEHTLQTGLIELDRESALLLGSAVWREDVGFVGLFGPRKAGKTSVALELIVHHGFSAFSDDFLIFAVEGDRAFAFRKPLRLRGDAAAYASLPEDALIAHQEGERVGSILVAAGPPEPPPELIGGALVRVHLEPDRPEGDEIVEAWGPEAPSDLLRFARRRERIVHLGTLGRLVERYTTHRLRSSTARHGATRLLAQLLAR